MIQSAQNVAEEYAYFCTSGYLCVCPEVVHVKHTSAHILNGPFNPCLIWENNECVQFDVRLIDKCVPVCHAMYPDPTTALAHCQLALPIHVLSLCVTYVFFCESILYTVGI
jgi:hypothetical protein